MTNDVIREVERYADALTNATPEVSELLPWVYDAERPTVTVAVTKTTSRRPVFVLAAAIAVVAILAIPLWLIALDSQAPAVPDEVTTPTVATTTSTTEAGTTAGPIGPAAGPRYGIGIDLPSGTVSGFLWPSGARVVVTLNGTDERYAVTDGTGSFTLSSAYDIEPGDVIAVTIEDQTKTIVARELTLDVFDRSTGSMSGLADFPDGTEIKVTVAFTADGEMREYFTTAVDGTWSLSIAETLGPDSSAVVGALDEDGDVYGWSLIPEG